MEEQLGYPRRADAPLQTAVPSPERDCAGPIKQDEPPSLAQQQTIAQLEAQITHLEASLQRQQQALDLIYTSLAWRLVSWIRRLTGRYCPPGTLQRPLAWMTDTLPFLLLPESLKRLVRYMRRCGLIATCHEIHYQLRLYKRALLHRFQPESQSQGPESTSQEDSASDGAYEAEQVPRLEAVPVQLLAFYLPQFHPIPENDRWWGKGFTEWSSVSAARPLFPGHHQPQLPGELGFYDLRLLEVMQRQIELAKQYGLRGFCFYFYWFHGQRLLERPVEQFLAHPELNLPFCLCWANENWTRRWDGQEHEVLMAQNYSPDNDLALIRAIEPYFRDPRYIRVDGKPLFLVYNPSRLPEPQATVQRWREYCRAVGIGDIWLTVAQTFGSADPRLFGCDAAVEFPPHPPHVAATAQRLTHSVPFFEPDFAGVVYDYADILRQLALEPSSYPLFRGIMPAWDNTARRNKRAWIFAHSSPQAYYEWLCRILLWTVQHHPPGQRLVFINAWNEWAEGTHLEPDRHYGYAYLNATARALQQVGIQIHGLSELAE